jgi:hypothetical protein
MQQVGYNCCAFGNEDIAKKEVKIDGSFVVSLHRPGIEPGSRPWQGRILPLDQRCQRLWILLTFDVAVHSCSVYVLHALARATLGVWRSPAHDASLRGVPTGLVSESGLIWGRLELDSGRRYHRGTADPPGRHAAPRDIGLGSWYEHTIQKASLQSRCLYELGIDHRIDKLEKRWTQW